MFTLDDLLRADRRPSPYEPGAELWNDPHIAKMMLETHLSPDTDSASYRPETIQAICAYLVRAMELKTGGAIADLGCGPGLYCEKLAGLGFCPTGIDRSENSIRYAKGRDSGSRYVLDSYLNPFGTELFDAALLIWHDYGVLSPENRETLLENVRTALKPGGRFALDVPSLSAFRDRMNHAAPKWYAAESGFWRPHKHVVLERTFVYPDVSAACDCVTVFDAGGATRYHIFQTYFSPESIRAELEQSGFRVEAVLSNLCGEAYHDGSPAIGVICKKL